MSFVSCQSFTAKLKEINKLIQGIADVLSGKQDKLKNCAGADLVAGDSVPTCAELDEKVGGILTTANNYTDEEIAKLKQTMGDEFASLFDTLFNKKAKTLFSLTNWTFEDADATDLKLVQPKSQCRAKVQTIVDDYNVQADDDIIVATGSVNVHVGALDVGRELMIINAGVNDVRVIGEADYVFASASEHKAWRGTALKLSGEYAAITMVGVSNNLAEVFGEVMESD